MLSLKPVFLFRDQIKETKCPSNPNYCMDKGKPFSGCNGHQRCEEYCSGPIEDFIYYNNTKATKDTEDKVSPCASFNTRFFE